MGEVKRLVDYLHYTLGKNEMKELLENSRRTQMCLLTLTSDIDGMKDLLNAVKNAVPATSVDQSTLSGVTLVDGQPVSSQTTEATVQSNESEFKSFLQQAIDFKIHISSQSPEYTRFETFPFEDVKQTQILDDELRVAASYAGRSGFWIKWKQYDTVPTMEDEPAVGYPSELTRSRVAELSTILKLSARPREICMPSCLGVIQDNGNDRFGFLLEFPGHEPSATAEGQKAKIPVSLQALPGRDSMALRGRVSLAQRLAQCIVPLHTVNWLHEGLRSASVLFFGPEATATGDAYISGFEYARPGRPNSDTSLGPPEDAEWRDYIHPDYLGHNRSEDFKRTYDIYSLGIVLVEIALWKRVKDTLVSTNDQTKHSAGISSANQTSSAAKPATTSHPDQIAAWLPAVEIAMGTKCRNETEACLRGVEAFGLDPKANQSDPVISALI